MSKYDHNDIQGWISDNLREDPVIIEAGVYDGSDTAWFAQKYPKGRIYGFEPLDIPFQLAHDRLCNFNNVTLCKYALGPKSGDGNMYACDWRSGASSLKKPTGQLTFHPTTVWVDLKGETKVDILNLDEFCLDEGIETVDFMWLDLQGSENEVIQSSKNIISKTKYIYSEVSIMEMYDGVPLIDEYKKNMNELGFDVVFEDLPWEDMGDILFENRNLEYVK
jgi:FkbM family methyltransferase